MRNELTRASTWQKRKEKSLIRRKQVISFLRYGYDTRIGLEDTLALPDGSLAPGNAELIALAVSRAAI